VPADSAELALLEDHDVTNQFTAMGISRQFEFLQSAWMMGTKFSGLTGESDPLLGNREAIPGCPVTDSFLIPEDGSVRRPCVGIAAVRDRARRRLFFPAESAGSEVLHWSIRSSFLALSSL